MIPVGSFFPMLLDSFKNVYKNCDSYFGKFCHRSKSVILIRDFPKEHGLFIRQTYDSRTLSIRTFWTSLNFIRLLRVERRKRLEAIGWISGYFWTPIHQFHNRLFKKCSKCLNICLLIGTVNMEDSRFLKTPKIDAKLRRCMATATEIGLVVIT